MIEEGSNFSQSKPPEGRGRSHEAEAEAEAEANKKRQLTWLGTKYGVGKARCKSPRGMAPSHRPDFHS